MIMPSKDTSHTGYGPALGGSFKFSVGCFPFLLRTFEKLGATRLLLVTHLQTGTESVKELSLRKKWEKLAGGRSDGGTRDPPSKSGRPGAVPWA